MVSMEEEAQSLRSKATELLLLEDWEEYIRLYTRFISLCSSGELLCGDPKLRSKILCGALSNRAEARLRLGHQLAAADDCDQALDLDPSHPRTLLCKGKILLNINCYYAAADCFRRALLTAPDGAATLRSLIDRCRKLEIQSKTGVFDVSEWVLAGFKGEPPELAEYVGPVEIRRSEVSGRGLFAARQIESGTTLVATKAVVVGRGILPESSDGARLVLWKDLVGRLLDAASKCRRTLRLIYHLSAGGDDEDALPVPDIRLFSPPDQRPLDRGDDDMEPTVDVDRILKILDVNCLAEDSAAAKVLGKNKGHGVGLWLLPSLVNHSCSPNARRLHVGDHVLVHASRDVKAGEEITFPYVDVLVPPRKRKEALEGTWGFRCRCRRCLLEAAAPYAGELGEMEGVMGAARLEEAMGKRWAVRRREQAFLRASFWEAYEAAYNGKKLERRIPPPAEVAESVAAAAGGDERLLKVMTRKKGAAAEAPVSNYEEERVTKIVRGVYGKVVKKRAAARALIAAAVS